MSINNEAVFCLSRGFAVPRFRPKAALVLSVWWRMTGSNRRPPACKAGALPAELIPRACLLSGSGVWPLAGLVGLEPTTPALSRRCSDQLSYRPRPPPPTPPTPFQHRMMVGVRFRSLLLSAVFFKKGGAPAAPSDTAALLRLHPSHEPCRGSLPPSGYANYFFQK